MRANDILQLSQNVSCKKMLLKYGDNYPENEIVMFSLKLMKINKKEKEQTRILLLTDKALYNLKATKIFSCKRRIAFDLIESISISSKHDIIIHVFEEYDYRYKSERNQFIADILATLCNKSNTNKRVLINKIRHNDVNMITCTKKQAKYLNAQQKRDRLNVYYSLVNHQQSHQESHHRSMSELNEEIFHKNKESLCLSPNSYTESDQLIDFDYDRLLVYSYFNELETDVPASIINCCLLYLSSIYEFFDRGLEDIWSDSLIIDDDQKTISMNDEYNGRTVYGSYIVFCDDNNIDTYIWRLRVNDIGEYNGMDDGSLWIGIDSTDYLQTNYTQCFARSHHSANYSFGGSNITGYNMWNKDKEIDYVEEIEETKPHILERGDYIEIILDLKAKMLKFVVNCDICYIVEHIDAKNKEYRLAVYLCNASVSIKKFKILQNK